jgi:transposase
LAAEGPLPVLSAPYSPHLNLAETLWRKLKTEWLVVEDYLEQDCLF